METSISVCRWLQHHGDGSAGSFLGGFVQHLSAKAGALMGLQHVFLDCCWTVMALEAMSCLGLKCCDLVICKKSCGFHNSSHFVTGESSGLSQHAPACHAAWISPKIAVGLMHPHALHDFRQPPYYWCDTQVVLFGEIVIFHRISPTCSWFCFVFPKGFSPVKTCEVKKVVPNN